MSTFQYPFNLPNPEFAHLVHYPLEVRVSKPTREGFIYFRVTLPEYLVERVKGISTAYGPDFVPILESLTFHGLCQQVEVIAQDSIFKPSHEETYGEKKLFVTVNTSAKQERSDYAGARREFLINISFGYFVAWVKDEAAPAINWGGEAIERPRRQQIYSAKTTSRSADNLSAGRGYRIPDENDLTALCHEGTHGYGFKAIMSRYKVLDYTPEREAFLQAIQDKLTGITTGLDTFFSQVNNEGIDQLMLDSPQLLLS